MFDFFLTKRRKKRVIKKLNFSLIVIAIDVVVVVFAVSYKIVIKIKKNDKQH